MIAGVGVAGTLDGGKKGSPGMVYLPKSLSQILVQASNLAR